MWMLIALVVIIGAGTVAYAAYRRSRAENKESLPPRINDDVRQAWSGRWKGTEIFSEHCKVEQGGLGLAKTIKAFVKDAGAPIMIAFSGPNKIGVDNAGRTILWGFAIRMTWPDLKGLEEAVASAVEQASWKNEGHGPLSFPTRGMNLDSIDEAMEWCGLGKTWLCNLDARPSERQQQERRVREAAPSMVLTGAYASIPGDGTTIVTLTANTVTVWEGTLGEKRISFVDSARDVRSVTVSPDGASVVTTSTISKGGHTASVWDARTATERFTLEGHGDGIWGAAFSPDGKRIVTASKDRTAKVWNAETGHLLLTFEGQGAVARCVAFFPDGRRVATGSAGRDPTVKVWDAEAGRVLANLTSRTPYLEQFCACAVSQDGTRLVAASSGISKHLVHVWDVGSGEEVLVMSGHTNLITSVAISPNGRYILSGCYDHKARILDAHTGTEMFELPVPDHGYNQVNSVAFFPNGERLLIASEKTGVRIWAAESFGLRFVD